MPLLWPAGPASAVLLAAASLGHSPHLHLYLTPSAAALQNYPLSFATASPPTSAAASLGHSPHVHLYLTPLAAAPIAGVTLAAHLAALHRPDLAESNWTNAAAATIVAVPIDTPALVAAAARAIGSARIG